MMKKALSSLRPMALFAIAAAVLCACENKRFNVSGEISNASDSTLYFENMSLDGPVAIDSAKLGADGSFSFSDKAPEAPEFYRLRIAGQIINLSVDSTESIKIKAAYPGMAANYTVEGSAECSTIKELALKQMELQRTAIAIQNAPDLNYKQAADSINRIVAAYKDTVKRQYIFKAPMRSSSYFALFQTLGNMLIFNPRQSEEDVKVFAAVATSWDTYHPDALRGKNLHNIAIEGMRNVRIIRNKQAAAMIDASKVSESGIIDISLQDNKGQTRKLSDLKGKVVMLDFHVFGSKTSTQRIMQLRELYNKFHNRGFEIYQVALDPDEHYWKTQTAALPWVSVRDPQGLQSQTLAIYNIQALPTFFLINRANALVKRDAQIKDIEQEVNTLLN